METQRYETILITEEEFYEINAAGVPFEVLYTAADYGFLGDTDD